MEDDALLLCLEELLFEAENDADLDEDADSPNADAGREEEKGGPRIEKDRAVVVSVPGGSQIPREAGYGGAVRELEKENARLRRALEKAEARMARANQVLWSLAGGGSGDREGGGTLSEDEEEGSVAGVSASEFFRGRCLMQRAGLLSARMRRR